MTLGRGQGFIFQEDNNMFEKIATIIAIVIAAGGIIWAVWFENFAGRGKKAEEIETEDTDTM